MPIYPRRDREGWIVSLANPGGTPPRIRKNAKTKLEAQQIEAGLVQKMRKGPLNLTTLTVCQYADAWLDRLPTYDLQPRTIGGYRQVLRQHVLPRVGRMVIQKITVPTVKELLAALSGQYAKNTIKNVKIAFSAMLSEAVEDGMIDMNPFYQLARSKRKGRPERVSPSERESKMKPLSMGEAERFLATARRLADEVGGMWVQWSLLFHLMLKTGLRPGEAYPLQWSDIDWGHRRMRIERAQERNGRIKSTKTEQGRWSDLSPNLIHALRNYRVLHARGDEDGIFWNVAGTHSPRDYDKESMPAFRGILSRADLLARRIYDLRHTFASIMLSAGVPLPYVSKQLGHTNQATTLTYYSKWIDTTRYPAYVAWLSSQQQSAKETEKSGRKNLLDSVWTPESIVPADFLDLLDKESVVESERNQGFIESNVAERVGFEPTVGVNPQRFSRP